MKIHILFTINKGPWGGGNQFLKAVIAELRRQGMYSDDPNKADVILWNSHHDSRRVIQARRQFSRAVFLHRIDGPIFSIRDSDKLTDTLIYTMNRFIADGTIFQSQWSKEKNIEQGIRNDVPSAVIWNAPDPTIFTKRPPRSISTNRKIRLVATSWSANPRKGFDVYSYLDERLDFRKYDMTFIGNTPIFFKNIQHIQPLPSQGLAKKLSENDLFITASLADPCSNSLLEALHSGLPAVVRNQGGHPELVGKGGVTFSSTGDVLTAIDAAVEAYDTLQQHLSLPTLKTVVQQYVDFATQVVEELRKPERLPKRMSSVQAWRVYALDFIARKLRHLT